MNAIRFASIPLLAVLTVLGGCATAPTTATGRQELKDEAVSTLAEMKAQDPGLDAFLRRAHGYVVFPRVGKGAYLVGGGYGRGIVYREGAPIGYADITLATVGLQIGGQAFSELIAFESAGDLNRFTAGRLAFSASLSAVILKTGAAESARYTDGVVILVKPLGGAMVEASVGGQQFTFRGE